MKQRLFSLTFLLVGISGVLAQESSNAPLSLQTLNLNEKSWVREVGFPITKYDFQNHEINAQLQKGLKERKKGKTLQTLGWVGAGAGLVLLFIPKDGTSSGGQTLAYGSAGLALGGITLSLVGSGKKRKARKKIENAAYLYEEKL